MKSYLVLAVLAGLLAFGIYSLPTETAVVAAAATPTLTPVAEGPSTVPSPVVTEAPPPTQWCIFGDSLTAGARDS